VGEWSEALDIMKHEVLLILEVLALLVMLTSLILLVVADQMGVRALFGLVTAAMFALSLRIRKDRLK
jgi:hypothetical protein